MFLIFVYLIGALGFSFLCSVLEAVLLSTPISFISMKQAEGARSADLLHKYKTDIDRPESAILSLNTISHTVGAAGVGAEVNRVFGNEYFAIASAIMTVLILVVSEIIPKTIGASYWRSLALPCTRIIRVVIVVCYPLVLLSDLIMHLVSPKNKPVSVSREEVSAMVSVGAEEGVFKQRESKTISSFLTSAKVVAEDVMTPSIVVASAPESMTVREFHADVHFKPYSRILVYKENRDVISGYVLRSTILEQMACDRFDQPISSLIRPILTFNEETPLSEIWERMMERKEHITAIVDDYGCLRGVVTMEDVVETMLGVEIVDENDVVTDMQRYARERWEKVKSNAAV